MIREFATGASRDTEEGKLDFEAFLSPEVLQRFAEYMHENRKMADGSLRDGDNWQKGIPVSAYMKSLWRHFMTVWRAYRRDERLPEQELCAMLFNVQGLLFETLVGLEVPLPPLDEALAAYQRTGGTLYEIPLDAEMIFGDPEAEKALRVNYDFESGEYQQD